LQACCNNIGCNEFDITTCLKNNSTFYPVYNCSDGPCLQANSSQAQSGKEKTEEQILFYALIAASFVGGIIIIASIIYVIRQKRKAAKIREIAAPLMNTTNLDDPGNSYL